MALIFVKITTTKPKDVPYYSDITPGHYEKTRNWEVTQLGKTLLYKFGTPIDENTYEHIEIYASYDAYNEYMTLKMSQPDYQERYAYNAANNIYSVVETGIFDQDTGNLITD